MACLKNSITLSEDFITPRRSIITIKGLRSIAAGINEVIFQDSKNELDTTKSPDQIPGGFVRFRPILMEKLCCIFSADIMFRENSFKKNYEKRRKILILCVVSIDET